MKKNSSAVIGKRKPVAVFDIDPPALKLRRGEILTNFISAIYDISR